MHKLHSTLIKPNMSPQQSRPHVVVFAFPFGSHAAGLLHLVRRLAAAAPDVRFSYFNTITSNQHVFGKANLKGYDNIKAYNVEDGVPEGHTFSGNSLEPIEFFFKALPENFKRRLDEVVEETGMKPTFILTDAFLGFSADIAAEMKTPWVAFWAGGPTSISLHMYTQLIHRKLLYGAGDEQNQDQKLDFLPGMSAIHTSDLPKDLLPTGRPFARLLLTMSRALPRAAAVVLNSFDGMDPSVENDVKSKLQKFLSIGPSPQPSPTLPFEDHEDCLPWLRNHPAASVAYISFGTAMTPPDQELVALAEALEEKQIPYLWSFRDNSKRGLIQGFFERTCRIGKVVQWAPQLQILAHPSVGVFVTHCGWNSVVESITGGVPMICRPGFGDHMVNRRLVEDVWGIGVAVDGGVFSKDGMKKALDLVMLEEEGRKMRKNIGKLRECASMAVAENGSSTKNLKALVDMISWSQQG